MSSILFLVLKFKHDCSCRAKTFSLTFCWPSTNKITGTKHHHKLIFHSSCHVQRVLLVSIKVEQGTIGVGNAQLPVITGALIVMAVTQRAMSCHCWWYLCPLHWMIQSLIRLSCPRFVNIHPALHRTQLHSHRIIQYLVGLQMIRQIPCHRRPPRMEVATFIYAWLMCLSWNWHKDNRIP